MDRLEALKASAGSGKTYSLTVRYLSLLFLGANPANIVALTFTKKAAQEMKERIDKTLRHLEGLSELESISKATSKSKEELLSAKKQVLKNFLHSPLHIETIDAFFGKILRKFSLHLGIMPDFATVDEMHSKKLEKLFIQEALRDEEYKNALMDFMIHEQKKLPNVFDFFISLYEKSKELDFSIHTRSSFVSEEKLLLKAAQIKAYLQDKVASSRAVGMFDVQDFSSLMKKSFWDKESLEYSTFSKVYTQALDELFYELKELFKSYAKQKEAFVLGRLFELFKLFERSNEKLIHQTNELTFNDVSFFVHRLLRENISNEFLYFRLDGDCEHLLIDEFQDTNLVQFDILEPIVKEISSGVGVKQKRTFFYVGDTKQSIYRFRGGSRELFDVVAKKYEITPKPLDTNFRSYERLVNFVNSTFKNLYDDFDEQKPDVKLLGKGYLSIKICDKSQEIVLENLHKSVQKLLENGVAEDDIAILCHTNKEASLIKQSLQEWNKKLFVSVENTRALLDSLSVKALVEFLKYSYFGYEINEKNTLVLLGKSFEQKLDIKLTNFDAPLSTQLIQAVQMLGLNGADEDILYFIEVASRHENIQSLLFGLERFSQKSQKTQSLGIKVLTIHKSKGLEFDNVIVVDRLSQVRSSSSSFLFEYDNDARLKALHLRMKNREYVDTRYKNALKKEKALELIDKKNAFYVAFTRAKKSLQIIKKDKSSAMDFLGLSEFEQGELEPSKAKEERKPLHIFEKIPSYGSQKHSHQEDAQNEAYDLDKVYFGLALHYLLEISLDFSPSSLQTAYKALQNRYGSLVDVCEVFKRVQFLSQDKDFTSLLEGGVLHKEKALLYKGQKKQLDLLVEFDDRYVIIDYKSSQNVQEEHLHQVRTYKKALESMSDKNVEAWLIYLRRDDIKKLFVE